LFFVLGSWFDVGTESGNNSSRKYFDKMQKKIGETNSADLIFDEPWREVVEELNQFTAENFKRRK
jgi:phage-related protein